MGLSRYPSTLGPFSERQPPLRGEALRRAGRGYLLRYELQGVLRHIFHPLACAVAWRGSLAPLRGVELEATDRPQRRWACGCDSRTLQVQREEMQHRRDYK